MFNIGPFPVTNSMLVTWIDVAAGVIVFAQVATRKDEGGAGLRAKFLGTAGGNAL